MKRALFLNVLCAFALFFLLLTGENTLHSKKVVQQDNTSTELISENLISQHQLKATSVVKDINLRKTNLTKPFIGATRVLLTSNWWEYIQNHHRLLQQTRFVPDKRKAISLLLYPYHYFW